VFESVEGGGMLFGNHKGMPWAERIDVEEGEDMPVLVHFVTRYLALDYECEDTELGVAHSNPLN
jgi:hypothetical protein